MNSRSLSKGYIYVLIMIVTVVVSLLCFPLNVNASGFAIYAQGAKELGMMNSVIAHTEGPASNFFNPALIGELKGTQLEIGTTLVFPSREFTSNLTGETVNTESNVYYPSTIFLTYQLNKTITLGFGINYTFGLGNEWPTDWEGRYLTTKSKLKSSNINPNMAWRVSDRLSFAGGIDILFGDATLEQNINFALYGLPDGGQKFEGDGTGYGFNLGFLYKIADNISFGISYRSEIKLEFDGEASFNLPSGSPPLLQASFLNTGAATTIYLPAQAFLGFSFMPTKNLILEIGGVWEGWSSYDELKFNFDNPVAGQSSILIEKNWDDTYGYNLGIKYIIDPTLALSAGYFYGGNPVPDDTVEPSVPSADRYDFSLGLQKILGKFTIAMSYLYEKYYDRDKNNSVGADTGLTANGKYESQSHMVAMSLTYRF